MERITLSKTAKAVYRLLNSGVISCPKTMDFASFNRGAIELMKYGLAFCHMEENGNVEVARLTDYGKTYISENPGLHEKRDWKGYVAVAAAVISAVCAIIGTVVACTIINS